MLELRNIAKVAGAETHIHPTSLALERGPEPWPEARRSLDGRVLSDHAPVEAVIASTS